MARIDGSDRILLQLQEQLQRLSKERQVRRGGVAKAGRSTGTPLERVRRLAGEAGIEQEELRRTIVRGMLLDQFGDQLGADPAFEAMMSQVFTLLERSNEGAELIRAAAAQLLEAKPSA